MWSSVRQNLGKLHKFQKNLEDKIKSVEFSSSSDFTNFRFFYFLEIFNLFFISFLSTYYNCFISFLLPNFSCFCIHDCNRSLNPHPQLPCLFIVLSPRPPSKIPTLDSLVLCLIYCFLFSSIQYSLLTTPRIQALPLEGCFIYPCFLGA